MRAGKSSGREDIGGYKSESDGKRYPKNLIKFNKCVAKKLLVFCDRFKHRIVERKWF